ncbi:universal stress protein [Geodermatophilus obscurus]|uniref:universal stress protein n=1 Tax=Geodermatophilus obscurus TaxID=1861 RepID=UPI000934C451|nr:universal stress protein [Geodermatophilus obscurus]
MTAVFRPVVAGIDGSPASLSVATAAARQARRALRPLRLVQASPGGNSRSPATGGRGRRGSADQLEAVCAAARSEAPAIPLRVVLQEGPADVVLLDESRTAALLVLGSGVTAAHRELGPVAAAVVRAAMCPALLERPIPTVARGVVVGVDCGPGTVPLLAAAMTEACLRSTSLLVVHAWGRRADGDRHAPYDGAVAESERRLVEQHVLPFRQTHPGVPVTVRTVHGGCSESSSPPLPRPSWSWWAGAASGVGCRTTRSVPWPLDPPRRSSSCPSARLSRSPTGSARDAPP